MVSHRQCGTVADGDRERIIDRSRMREYTSVRSHVGRSSGVEVPLRGLWCGRRGVGRIQHGEEGLVISGIHGRRRGEAGRRGWADEVSLMR